eukprot:GFKZ01004011.1.p1 GENE.GFKZ01004011.1~~GFKZ01004011.1.p1  ORF type:complete len:104 (-),score=16.22 GFKZ01004011.1:10-321(-)
MNFGSARRKDVHQMKQAATKVQGKYAGAARLWDGRRRGRRYSQMPLLLPLEDERDGGDGRGELRRGTTRQGWEGKMGRAELLFFDGVGGDVDVEMLLLHTVQY